MSKERTGVRILLTPETQIPDWVMQSPGVSLGTTEIHGRVVPTVDVEKGEGGFIPGGAVDLRTGRRQYRAAFGPNSVLEIQTLDGRLVKRNHHMCIECGANTGTRISYSPSEEIFGTVDAVFQCGQNPEHGWKVKNT